MKTCIFIFSFLFLFALNAIAQEHNLLRVYTDTKRIAYSEKSGVEVFAKIKDKNWCETNVSLQILAQNETSFTLPALTKLMQRIGIVLQNQCPIAKQAGVEGFVLNTLLYQGTASLTNDWKPEKETPQLKIQKLQMPENSLNKISDLTKITAYIDPKTALEYQITSKDGRCALLYTTDKPASVLRKWFITVENNTCRETLISGRAKVSLFDEKSKPAGTVEGYFTDGRFTGYRNLNVSFLNRYGFDKNLQNLSYLIESDPELKIHYVGYLTSIKNPKTGRYSAWKGCDPFVIAAVTENEDLFLNDTVTNNILRTAQSFADVFCPGTTRMKFFASSLAKSIKGMDFPDNKDPLTLQTNNTELFYATNLNRKIGGKWENATETSINWARIRENERRNQETREHQLMLADYNELAKSDYLGRLGYKHGVERIDNLTAMLVAYRLLNTPIRINTLISINALTKNKATTDFPLPLRIREGADILEKTGWYIVSGELYASPVSSDVEKSVSWDQGVLDLTAATPCSEPFCAEVSNVTSLVRNRYDKQDWSPFKYASERNKK